MGKTGGKHTQKKGGPNDRQAFEMQKIEAGRTREEQRRRQAGERGAQAVIVGGGGGRESASKDAASILGARDGDLAAGR